MIRANIVHRLMIPALILAGCLIAGYGVSYLPLREGKAPRLLYWEQFEIPVEPEYYFFEPVGDELSHTIFYHDLGDSINAARQADIIFIGNSRLNLGLRGEVIVEEAERLGLKVFPLGFGFGEAHRFPMEILRRHNLSPKLVVSTGGPWFYGDRISEIGLEAMNMSRWDAVKKRLEAVAVFNLTYLLHQYLPRFDIYNKELYPAWISYRSARTGFLKVVREPGASFPVANDKEPVDYQHRIASVSNMNEELAARGSLLITTVVPFTRTRSGHLQEINHELGVPYILPSFTGLTSGDASHLDARSARIYAKRFWEALVSHPAVIERLNL